MQQRFLNACVLGAGLVLLASAASGAWNEEDFYKKKPETFVVVGGSDLARAASVVGSRRYYTAHKGDTFFDLARFYGLGYNELVDANPKVDPWLPWYPSETRQIELPTQWVLPQVDYVGIVVNIPEMRLYYFPPHKAGEPQRMTTFAVGLGRDDWRTPQGKFRVRGKTINPTWNIPESIRKEHIADRGDPRTSIPGGAPDNPLGKYRIELTLPLYGIHGTNIPWGVGMQVSHGCVRLYPEDIEQFFPMVPVGTPGQFVYQPVKIGARGGRIYAEVHKDIYDLTPALYQQARNILVKLGWQDRIDQERLLKTIEEQSGVPVDITAGGVKELAPENDLRRTGFDVPNG